MCSSSCFVRIRHQFVGLISNQERLCFIVILLILVIIQRNPILFFEGAHAAIARFNQQGLDLFLDFCEVLLDCSSLAVLGCVELEHVTRSISGHIHHLHLLNVVCLHSGIKERFTKFTIQNE